jgi:hypothetical protein
MEDRLASLYAELKAIELWDDIYHRQGSRDQLDEMSYRARRERWQEITREILELAARLDD